MGLFDFFRKIIETEREDSKIEQEKISFSEIRNWIERKRTEIEVKEKEVFYLVQEKIRVFAQEIRGKIKIVEGFDIESKKADDKINFIVNDGRKKYIESLEDFIGKLEKLGKEKLVNNLNRIFSDFNKNSYKSYERTTILIGKEMADIKNVLKAFSKDFTKMFGENKNISNLSKTISLIELKLNQVDDEEIIIRKVNEAIISLDEKISDEKGKKEKILREIEKVKKSENYKKNLDRQKSVKLLGEELEKDLLSLKQSIDFKALTNFFHIFKEQMDIVKSHREDFHTKFKEDDGESISRLLEESKLNNEVTSEKIRQINSKKEEMVKNEGKIEKDETKELSFKITNIILEIDNLNNEKVKEGKRNVKIKIDRERIIMEIKGNLIKEGVVIVP